MAGDRYDNGDFCINNAYIYKNHNTEQNMTYTPIMDELYEHVSDLSGRYGMIKFSKEWLQNQDSNTLRAMLSEFYPLSIEFDYNTIINGIVVYYGMSLHFEKVMEGCVIPEYRAYIKQDESGVCSLEKFERL